MNVRYWQAIKGAWSRLSAVMLKEFIQMRRDKTTVGMIVGIPLIQLTLFGYAINMNPRHLPTAIVGNTQDVIARRILVSMQNSTYFQFIQPPMREDQAQNLLKQGKIQFIVNFPPKFYHDVVKGLRPSLLLQADATDPAATSRAVSVFSDLSNLALAEDLRGPLESIKSNPSSFQPLVHSIYNPLAITSYNIVPGLLGVILTMTMVMITAIAITREYERGTMENLLSTPLKPLEVMVGKIVPYIIVGYVQVLLVLVLARFLFAVPTQGSLFLLLLLCLPFVAANLAMGLTFSTLATNQLQAVQVAMFFFLPSILLSGFMFPFRGMPSWAQFIGNCLPLTHFIVIVRGILLKGNGWLEVWREIVPIISFMIGVMWISFKRYRETLD